MTGGTRAKQRSSFVGSLIDKVLLCIALLAILIVSHIPSLKLFRLAAPQIASRSPLKLLTQEFCDYHATVEISLSGPHWWSPGTQGTFNTFDACGWDSSASFHPCTDRSHSWDPPSPTACCRITHTRRQHRRSISSAAGTVVQRREEFSRLDSVGSVFFPCIDSVTFMSRSFDLTRHLSTDLTRRDAFLS